MPHVWVCIITNITACVFLGPKYSVARKWLGDNSIWLEYFISPVSMCSPPFLFLLLLPYGASASPTETDCERILERSPAVLNDLLNLIPVWWSFSVLAPWFPGEDEVGSLGAPPSLLFLSCSQFLLCSSLSHIPWGYHAPSSLSVREPGWLLSFVRKTSLR